MGELTEPAGWRLLTDAQRAASARVIAEESARREHVVVSLSGAHAYGFPSHDSDVDLKAIHVAPTASLVGMQPLPPGASRMEWVDGVEMDYSSNEIGAALGSMLKGNGNFLERVLGQAPVGTSSWLDALAPVMRRALSRRAHRHYRGFAQSQLAEFDAKPTAKKLLYVLRTALTGTHLMRTGELVVDVTELLDTYGFGDARELVDAKRRGENALLDAARRDPWRASVARAFTALDEAHDGSALPAEAPNVAEIEDWLLQLRRARF